MDTKIDYYALLGLSPSAEAEVIQAVYRALAKKYHPDVYNGDKAEAERIMKDLNEAIRVLSDPKLREQYDATRSNSESNTENFDETIHESGPTDEDVYEKSIEEAFKQGAEFYPDAEKYRLKLARLSYTLSIAYVAHITARKEFEKAEAIYIALREDFYTKYFGTASEVLKLAEYLLDEHSPKVSNERRTKAKKLNQAIKVVGSPTDSVSFVRQFMKLNGIKELDVFGQSRSDWTLSEPTNSGVSSLDNKARRRNNIIFLSVFAAVAIGVAAVIFWQDNEKKKRAYDRAFETFVACEKSYRARIKRNEDFIIENMFETYMKDMVDSAYAKDRRLRDERRMYCIQPKR